MNAQMNSHGSREALMVRTVIPPPPPRAHSEPYLLPELKAFPGMSQAPCYFAITAAQVGEQLSYLCHTKLDLPVLGGKCGLSVWELYFPWGSSSEPCNCSNLLCIRIQGSVSYGSVLTTTMDTKRGSLTRPTPSQHPPPPSLLTPNTPKNKRI